MKSLKNTLAFFVLTMSLIFSCNIEPFEGDVVDETDDDVIIDSGGSTEASFNVDFDNNTFEADNISATIVDDIINITGLKTSTNEGVILTIFGSETGTYKLGVTENQVEVNGAAYNTDLTGSGDSWIAVTDFITSQGEITISEIDEVNKTISGTFFFTGHNTISPSKEFTNGVFTNVSYGAGLVSPDGNTFFAKVDGEEFVEDSINGAALSLPGMSTISITATKNSLETIGLTFDADIEPGDYSFSGLSTPLAQYNLSFTDSNLGEGTFTITSHDKENKRIIGTFLFTASPLFGGTQSYEITEGSFDVTYL